MLPREASASPAPEASAKRHLMPALSEIDEPVDRTQLLRLAKLSKNLHISKANYTIPIPLTLQLPPKLQQQTPERRRTRLVFNGHEYEPVWLDLDSEKRLRPPSLAKNRKKVAHFVKTHSVPQDQLSMIEEKSTRLNSIASSKQLPLVPDDYETPPLRIARDPRTPPNEALHVRLPHSKPYHHNLNLGEETVLKISKRLYSDESLVSSVSSFSAIGDLLNMHRPSVRRPHDPLQRLSENIKGYLNIGETRTPSLQSSGGESASSKNSIQDSLDFSVYGKKDEWVDVEDKPKDEWVDVEDEPKDEREDNNGAGISFSFPNDCSNATNRPKPRPKPKSVSMYSLRSPEGQIQIPDLDDGSILRAFSAKSHSEKGSSYMEPLGVPSSAAKSHFDALYGESDSDGSFNSQFAKLMSESEGTQRTEAPKELPQSVSLGTLSTRSPVKHRRNRSMFNIDYQAEPLKPGAISGEETVGLTLKDDRAQAVSLAQAGAHKKAISETTIPNKLARKSPDGPCPETKAEMYKVAEPPKKVEYAVDFRVALHGRTADDFSTYHHPDYYNKSPMRRRTQLESLSKELLKNPSGTETASSYQSSKTARQTASTAPSETGSVVIDLTRDNYNLCMVKRNDLTLSYKSVIENKNGKAVEVVLVEEEEDNGRDDLSSIYSRYMHSWGRRDSLKRHSGAKTGRLVLERVAVHDKHTPLLRLKTVDEWRTAKNDYFDYTNEL